LHASRFHPSSAPCENLLGLPKEIIAGLLIISLAATATGIFSSSPHHPHAAASAAAPPTGGGGAFVGTPAPDDDIDRGADDHHLATHHATGTTTTQAPPPVRRATPTTSPPTAATTGAHQRCGRCVRRRHQPFGGGRLRPRNSAHVSVVRRLPSGGSWPTIDGAGGSLGWLFDAWRGSGYQASSWACPCSTTPAPTHWPRAPPVCTTSTS